MKTLTIKDCPCCGSDKVDIQAGMSRFVVVCGDCGTYGMFNQNLYAAVAAWNRRPEPDLHVR
jgi:transcription elongation factor Elf1